MSTGLMQPLTPAEMEILEFERQPWPRTGTGRKDSAILDRFGDSPTRYYQRLHAICAKPAALAYDAETVNRLARLAAKRANHRSATARGVTL